MSQVLVLNRSFNAIHIVGWKRAMSLLFCGMAEAVDENYATYSFEDWKALSAEMKEHPGGFVNTPNYKLARPEIIRLTLYDRLPKKDVKFTRRNIYEHYGFKCSYCGERFPTTNLNLDHIVPRAQGGKTDWTNIVPACVECNTEKRDRTPAEAKMPLLVKPSRPSWKGSRSFVEFPPGKLPISWQKILDSNYWDSELER